MGVEFGVVRNLWRNSALHFEVRAPHVYSWHDRCRLAWRSPRVQFISEARSLHFCSRHERCRLAQLWPVGKPSIDLYLYNWGALRACRRPGGFRGFFLGPFWGCLCAARRFILFIRVACVRRAGPTPSDGTCDFVMPRLVASTCTVCLYARRMRNA